MIKVIKLICVVLVGYFIVRVMFPSLMPLKINTNIAFVAAVAGIVVYIFSDKVPDKLLTHFCKKKNRDCYFPLKKIDYFVIYNSCNKN